MELLSEQGREAQAGRTRRQLLVDRNRIDARRRVIVADADPKQPPVPIPGDRTDPSAAGRPLTVIEPVTEPVTAFTRVKTCVNQHARSSSLPSKATPPLKSGRVVPALRLRQDVELSHQVARRGRDRRRRHKQEDTSGRHRCDTTNDAPPQTRTLLNITVSLPQKGHHRRPHDERDRPSLGTRKEPADRVGSRVGSTSAATHAGPPVGRC